MVIQGLFSRGQSPEPITFSPQSVVPNSKESITQDQNGVTLVCDVKKSIQLASTLVYPLIQSKRGQTILFDYNSIITQRVGDKPPQLTHGTLFYCFYCESNTDQIPVEFRVHSSLIYVGPNNLQISSKHVDLKLENCLCEIVIITAHFSPMQF